MFKKRGLFVPHPRRKVLASKKLSKIGLKGPYPKLHPSPLTPVFAREPDGVKSVPVEKDRRAPANLETGGVDSSLTRILGGYRHHRMVKKDHQLNLLKLRGYAGAFPKEVGLVRVEV